VSPKLGSVTRTIAGTAALLFAGAAAGAGYFRDWSAVATLLTMAVLFGAAAVLGRDTVTDDQAHRTFRLGRGRRAGRDDGAA
jgi:hypothetical protein